MASGFGGGFQPGGIEVLGYLRVGLAAQDAELIAQPGCFLELAGLCRGLHPKS